MPALYKARMEEPEAGPKQEGDRKQRKMAGTRPSVTEGQTRIEGDTVTERDGKEHWKKGSVRQTSRTQPCKPISPAAMGVADWLTKRGHHRASEEAGLGPACVTKDPVARMQFSRVFVLCVPDPGFGPQRTEKR